MIKRLNLQIEGIVQGVGFRPFVFSLARKNSLSGWVLNNSIGVEIEIEGEESSLKTFLSLLRKNSPPLCKINTIHAHEITATGEKSFTILESKQLNTRLPLISPDTDVCDDCLKELFNPSDRRYRYPFINCTNCGPRFTIIKDIPYDRDKTTMQIFPMCPLCEKEYHDPSNRRFHAQPIACWQCGPRLSLIDHSGHRIKTNDPIKETIKLLNSGHIVAIKGLGGFHLSVDATNHEAVLRLREKKHREEKPFAIMVRDIGKAKRICRISALEEKILSLCSKPILLLKKRPAHSIAESVAPGNNFFGIMLPYTPIHHLLLQECFDALVMTSANISEEPIVKDNDEALYRLSGIADYFLLHNRDIHIRTDDSIMRTMSKKITVIRRSRGQVPAAIPLIEQGKNILALGGELKNTVCFTKDTNAFISQYIGDMENAETYRIFIESIQHLQRLLQVSPEMLAYDLHPDYLATKYALEQKDIAAIGIQHHFAHVVSCLAENGMDEPAIGVAFDGTGYGDDGNIWGGEFFTFSYSGYTRKGHFDYIPMPGADAAAREPYRMAVSYLYRTFRDKIFSLNLPVIQKRQAAIKTLIKMIDRKFNTPLTSSCGRLFDAVASIVGLREIMTFEGQAPMELEMAIKKPHNSSYDFTVSAGENDVTFCICFEPMIQQIAEDVQRDRSVSYISCKFHNTITSLIVSVCEEIRKQEAINLAALSGGVFQNLYLLNRTVAHLQKKGFRVITHQKVPPNDGGISLGQAVAARRACKC